MSKDAIVCMVADIWRSLSSRLSFRLLILLHIGTWQLTLDKRDLQALNKTFTLRVLHTRQTCAEAHICGSQPVVLDAVSLLSTKR